MIIYHPVTNLGGPHAFLRCEKSLFGLLLDFCRRPHHVKLIPKTCKRMWSGSKSNKTVSPESINQRTRLPCVFVCVCGAHTNHRELRGNLGREFPGRTLELGFFRRCKNSRCSKSRCQLPPLAILFLHTKAMHYREQKVSESVPGFH